MIEDIKNILRFFCDKEIIAGLIVILTGLTLLMPVIVLSVCIAQVILNYFGIPTEALRK